MKPFPPELIAAYPGDPLSSRIPDRPWRHEEGSIFHCNARTATGVVAFDCDGRGEHACETCNE
jgi:hypothetical protein